MTSYGLKFDFATVGAYERYNDGRQQWSSIILGGRTLARLIWLHVPDAPRPYDSKDLPTEEEVSSQSSPTKILHISCSYCQADLIIAFEVNH